MTRAAVVIAGIASVGNAPAASKLPRAATGMPNVIWREPFIDEHGSWQLGGPLMIINGSVASLSAGGSTLADVPGLLELKPLIGAYSHLDAARPLA